MSLTPASPAPYLFELPQIGDDALGFIAIAEAAALPFPLARVYWTYLTPTEVERGNHAHHRLEQLVFALSGRLEITLEGPDGMPREFVLTEPQMGLFIPAMHWRTIRFREQAVLLCLASEAYYEASYIHDYAEFRALSGQSGPAS